MKNVDGDANGNEVPVNQSGLSNQLYGKELEKLRNNQKIGRLIDTKSMDFLYDENELYDVLSGKPINPLQRVNKDNLCLNLNDVNMKCKWNENSNEKSKDSDGICKPLDEFSNEKLIIKKSEFRASFSDLDHVIEFSETEIRIISPCKSMEDCSDRKEKSDNVG